MLPALPTRVRTSSDVPIRSRTSSEVPTRVRSSTLSEVSTGVATRIKSSRSSVVFHEDLARHEILFRKKSFFSVFSRDFEFRGSKELVIHGRRCVKILTACTIPWLVPLMEAFRSVGFKWADEAGIRFSTIIPLIFGTLILGTLFLLILLIHHGCHEFRQLADIRYLGFMVPAFFRTGLFVGVNWAIWEGMSATCLVMVMKSALLPGILGEMWLTQKWPFITHLWSVAAIILCIATYTLSTMDTDLTFSNMALIYSIGAAQCDFVGGLGLEAGIRLRLAKTNVNKDAEKIRCQLMNEIWKGLFYVILVLIFEMNFVFDGVVRGWNIQIILGAVVTIPPYVAIYNYSCIAVGTLQTNIFSSVDIGTTCILEYLVFGEPITITQGLLISIITLLILIYSTLIIDLRRNAKDTQHESIVSTASDNGKFQDDFNDEVHIQKIKKNQIVQL